MLSRHDDSNSWRMSTWWMPDARSSVQDSTLRLLSVAHSQRLDPAVLLRQLAMEHRGFAARRLNLIAARLESGTPLVDALEQTPDALTDEDTLTLRLAVHAGTTSEAYASLLKQAADRSSSMRSLLWQVILYGVVVAISSILVLSLLMGFIAPQYQELFADFGIRLPAPLRSFIATWDIAASWVVPCFVTVLVLAVVVQSLFQPLRYVRRVFLSRWSRNSSKLRTAHLLRLLAIAIKHGRPLPGALATLARHHFDRNVRSKLLFARNEVELGSDVWSSLAETAVLSPSEAQVISDASSVSMQCWLMEKLADQREQEVRYRRAFWAVLAHPAMILCFSGLILWAVVAFFTVLVSMIYSLA